jgi:hypothetical protein
VPVIVLSAVTTHKPPRAQRFVHKPFSLETLVQAINDCLDEGAGDGVPAAT